MYKAVNKFLIQNGFFKVKYNPEEIDFLSSDGKKEQFDKSNDPLVKSIVKADNYIDAVTKAKLYMNLDYKDVNVMDYNVI